MAFYNISKRQRKVCEDAIAKSSQMERDLSEEYDELVKKMESVEAKFKKWRKVGCDAINMINGIIPFDKSKLS